MTGTPYTVFGYKGKQVRDNIHSADLIRAFDDVLRSPASRRGLQHRRRPLQQLLDARGDRALRGDHRPRAEWTYAEDNRIGDHIWWISDTCQVPGPLSRLAAHLRRAGDSPGNCGRRPRALARGSCPRKLLMSGGIALLEGRHIIVVSMHYWPEETGIAPYSTGVAEHLAAIGAKVTVLTAMPFYPGWKVFDTYSGRLRIMERHNDVTIRRIRHYVPARQSALRRAMHEGSFFLHGVPISRHERPDAVIGVIPSISGGVLAASIAKRFNVPYGLIVQDLSGQAAAQSGMPGGSRVAGITTALESRIAKGARRVAVVSEAFKWHLEELGVNPSSISELRNWSHIPPPTVAREIVRARFGWKEHNFVVLHAGNMGLKQALENVTDAARLASASHPHLRFVLMGDGNQRVELERQAEGLNNISFLSPEPTGDLANALAAADVLLVNERATVVDMSLPSKLTSYFVAGQPVLAAVRSDGTAAREVERAQAGVVVPPDADTSRRTEDLGRDPARRAKLGSAGQAYARDHLGPDTAMKCLEIICAWNTDGANPIKLELFCIESSGSLNASGKRTVAQ